MPIPAAIAAAAAIGTGLLGARSARRNTDRTIRANREMAEYAYSKELEAWHRQNEYNRPVAQMERFRDAGLNPHLIYGQGTAGQATQMPQYNAPRLDYNYRPAVDPLSAVSAYMDLNQKSANIDLTKSQVNVQKTMDVLNTVRSDGILQENTIRALESTIAQKILMDHGASLNDVAFGRIGAMKADNWLRQAGAEIRQWEAGLTRKGINPRDSVALRMLVERLDSFGFSGDMLMNVLGVTAVGALGTTAAMKLIRGRAIKKAKGTTRVYKYPGRTYQTR